MRSTLEPGQFLLQGEELTSPNGAYYAPLQHDGNFVVYRKAGNVARWSTQTKDGAKLIMQTDGNLVLYNDKEDPVWSSNTARRPNSYVVLQDDGNLVIYQRVPIFDIGADPK